MQNPMSVCLRLLFRLTLFLFAREVGELVEKLTVSAVETQSLFNLLDFTLNLLSLLVDSECLFKQIVLVLSHVLCDLCSLSCFVLLVLKIFVELFAVLVEGALSLLELFFLHNDELTQSLSLFVFIVDRDLREEDLASVGYVVSDGLFLIAMLEVLLECLYFVVSRAVTFSLLKGCFTAICCWPARECLLDITEASSSSSA